MSEVFLHVQTSNEEAIDFFTKRGFVVGEMVKGYYKRIDPPDARILSFRVPPPVALVATS